MLFQRDGEGTRRGEQPFLEKVQNELAAVFALRPVLPAATFGVLAEKECASRSFAV
jgi:hypothetical protein